MYTDIKARPRELRLERVLLHKCTRTTTVVFVWTADTLSILVVE